MRKTAIVAFILLMLAPLPPLLPFASKLPAGMPSMQGWEKLSGAADLDEPRARVEYEFYVNPRRPGIYELIRYRVTLPVGTRHAADYPAFEKVQWQRSARDLRRFECQPGPNPAAPCRWRELPQGSAAYAREVPVIIWLYGVHRNLAGDRLAD